MSSEKDLGKVICEEWKPIAGYEGIYEVSNFGNVRSVDRIGFQKNRHGGISRYFFTGKSLKPTKNKNGYLTVDLHRNGKTERYLIHRLVGFAFLEKPDEKNCINHLDANKRNNHVNNLEWCNQSENIQYAYDKGTKTPPHMKKVAQFDLDGNLLKVWASKSEIEKKLHIKNVYKVCSGKRTQAGGFKWQYIE